MRSLNLFDLDPVPMWISISIVNVSTTLQNLRSYFKFRNANLGSFPLKHSNIFFDILETMLRIDLILYDLHLRASLPVWWFDRLSMMVNIWISNLHNRFRSNSFGHRTFRFINLLFPYEIELGPDGVNWFDIIHHCVWKK